MTAWVTYYALMAVYLPWVLLCSGQFFPDSPAGAVFRFIFGV
jgi:hypothetical protein